MAVAKLLLVGTCIVGIGLLLHIIGMATTYWTVEKHEEDHQKITTTIGLFKVCEEDGCRDLPSQFLRSQDKAVQAMAILGVLAGFAGVLGTLAFVTLTHVGKNPVSLMRIGSGLVCIVAGVFITICVIVYGAKIFKDFHDSAQDAEKNFHDSVHDAVSLGYSFGLSTTGGVLFLIGGCIIAGTRGSQDERFTS